MRTLKNPWFVVFCLVWLVVFLSRKNGIHLPEFAAKYLTDLLAVPVVAHLGLWFQRMLYRSETYRLAAGHVIFTTVYITVVFELVLPHFSSRYTADLNDVFCYILGAFFFWKVMNR